LIKKKGIKISDDSILKFRIAENSEITYRTKISGMTVCEKDLHYIQLKV